MSRLPICFRCPNRAYRVISMENSLKTCGLLLIRVPLCCSSFPVSLGRFACAMLSHRLKPFCCCGSTTCRWTSILNCITADTKCTCNFTAHDADDHTAEATVFVVHVSVLVWFIFTHLSSLRATSPDSTFVPSIRLFL